jgi:hypothetical protein
MRRTESLVAIQGQGFDLVPVVFDKSLDTGTGTSSTPIMERVMSSKSCLKKLDGTSSNHSSLSNMQRSVSFHQIEINQFSVEIGDNPCADGVPIQIGWTFWIWNCTNKANRNRAIDMQCTCPHKFDMPYCLRMAPKPKTWGMPYEKCKRLKRVACDPSKIKGGIHSIIRWKRRDGNSKGWPVFPL